MTYIICERCQNSFKLDNEFNYLKRTDDYKKCHKCYVCSETDLHNAEVFKGVTFCFSCAQRIFQSCDSVKKKKLQANYRGKKVRSRSRRLSQMERRRKHELSRPYDRKLDRDVHRVIELSQQVGSSSDSYPSDAIKKRVKTRKPQLTTGLALQVPKYVSYEWQRQTSNKKQSTEKGVATDITQELIKEINACFKNTASDQINHNPAVAPIPRVISPMMSREKEDEMLHQISDSQNKPIYSDLRIAEIGASTEIANMTLRKKSEVPVIIRSENQLKAMKSYSDSFLNQPAKRRNGQDYLDSAYGSLKNSETWANCLDGGLSNVMKLPLKFFKKNILNRSSLISSLMTAKDKVGLFRRIKNVFYEDLTKQQSRGVKRLYSTINRRKAAYKLGCGLLESATKSATLTYDSTTSDGILKTKPYETNLFKIDNSEAFMRRGRHFDYSRLHLASKVSRAKFRQRNCNGVAEVGCKHYRISPSYRCMRDQVMELAGPTRSQLASIRRKIKGYMTAKGVRDTMRCLYIDNQLSILEKPDEQAVPLQIKRSVLQTTHESVQLYNQQLIQEAVQKSTRQIIHNTVQKRTRQPICKTVQKLNQHSYCTTSQQLTQQSNRQSDLKLIYSTPQPVQEIQLSAHKPVQRFTPQLSPLVNQQRFQKVTHPPIQQVTRQPIHQPNYYLQSVYQARTDHNIEKQKEMRKRYPYLTTRVSC